MSGALVLRRATLGDLSKLLHDIFPNSLHIRQTGAGGATDATVWQLAKTHLCLLVSKDGLSSPQRASRRAAEGYLDSPWKLQHGGNCAAFATTSCRYSAFRRARRSHIPGTWLVSAGPTKRWSSRPSRRSRSGSLAAQRTRLIVKPPGDNVSMENKDNQGSGRNFETLALRVFERLGHLCQPGFRLDASGKRKSPSSSTLVQPKRNFSSNCK